GSELQAMQRALRMGTVERRSAVSHGEEQQYRGQGDGDESSHSAWIAGAELPKGHADMAGGGAGQELAKRDDVDIGRVVEPLAAFDELGAEIAEMCDRTTEAGAAEAEEGEEYFGDCAALHRMWVPQ